MGSQIRLPLPYATGLPAEKGLGECTGWFRSGSVHFNSFELIPLQTYKVSSFSVNNAALIRLIQNTTSSLVEVTVWISKTGGS